VTAADDRLVEERRERVAAVTRAAVDAGFLARIPVTEPDPAGAADEAGN
jgi:hypothetical protein